jgi:hypothetical protein
MQIKNSGWMMAHKNCRGLHTSLVRREDASTLELRAICLKREGMHSILDAASAQVKAARLLQSAGDNRSKELLADAAKLYEKGEAPIGAVFIYLELGDFGGVRSIAERVACEVGQDSQFGKALLNFRNSPEGSERERECIAELKDKAQQFIGALERFAERLSNSVEKTGRR